jgi:phage-related tail fiber protein
MKPIFATLLLLTGLFTSTACSDKKDSSTPTPALPVVSGTFSGAQEVPAVTTSAAGTFDGTYNKTTMELKYTVTFTGLTPTAGHLHTGAPGVNGPVFHPFAFNNPTNNGFVSPITGTVTLTEAQATSLMNRSVYANLHTAARPGGEIRADLIVK